MKRKLAKAFIIVLVVLGIMYAEYRYIMVNQYIYKGDGNTVYVEIFGNVDEYYVPQGGIKYGKT